jgi:diadenosine tetraphosphatase ApaH/serine/threonine PP2A family protein phosphatase
MPRMKLALLSDLHANRRALQACLAHARAAGATQFALLGDLVGYGAEPAAVVEEAMALQAQGGIVLKGNHDEAALRAPEDESTQERASSSWTHRHLPPEHRAFLSRLPLTASLHGLLLVHASAENPRDWRYVDRVELAGRCLDAAHGAGWDHVVCGHVHRQMLYYESRRSLMSFQPAVAVPVPLAAHRRWLATIGSVGQPRDGDPRAMYALFDVAQQRLAFHRVPYDHLGAAAAIRRAGLPESFAIRLELGQ